MDYTEILSNFPTHTPHDISNVDTGEYMHAKQYKQWIGMLDVTSLNPTDTPDDIARLCKKVVDMNANNPDIPMPASICVYPQLVESAGLALGDASIDITSVAGGFPSSQTFIEVKALECAMAEENGADEIDVVLNISAFLSGDFGTAEGELEIIRGELSPDTTLKVIIESGLLPDQNAVRAASLLALSAGADFIKTSTGKVGVGATPESVATMCEALIDFETQTGNRRAIKVAGGIRSAKDIAHYHAIVERILGKEWVLNDGLRIGGSQVLDDLLNKLK